MISKKFFLNVSQLCPRMRVKLIGEVPEVYTVIGADELGIFIKTETAERWINMSQIVWIEKLPAWDDTPARDNTPDLATQPDFDYEPFSDWD